MINSKLLTKSALGAVLLTLITVVLRTIHGGPHDASVYLWLLPANFLVAWILGLYITHSSFIGIRLASAVFLIYFIIGHFNILIEAWVFNVTDRPETTRQIITGLVTSLVAAPLFVRIFDKWKGTSTRLNFVPRSVIGWISRVALVDLVYFLCYGLAGFSLQALYPELLDFYEGKLPPISVMIQTQVFCRAFLFAGIAILILRSTSMELLQTSLLVGLTFTILGGLAPLIPPNELMPRNIRIAHGFEVTLSNFIFGVLASYILGQKKTTS